MFLAVCTAHSAAPLACGCRGDVVRWVNPQSVANNLNSSEAYCGLLSDTSTVGAPWVAKISLSAMMTLREVVEDSSLKSSQHEE